MVYEAYEVKNKKRKITLSFSSPEKEEYFQYIINSLLHRKKLLL